MKRRFLSWILVFGMALSLLPVNTQAAGTQWEQGLNREKDFTQQADAGLNAVYDEVSFDHITLTDVGDHEYLESEPNDNVNQANAVYHDYTVYGDISGDNLDCYMFELTETSQVTVISACTTYGLVYAIADVYLEEFVAESEYIDYDEETGLYADGLICELPAGLYCLVFADYYEDYLEYGFYLEIESSVHVHDNITSYPSGRYHKINCSGCGYRVTEDCYSINEDVVAATCTTDGSVSFTCDVCNTRYYDTIPATGHSWNSGTVVRAATPQSTGVMEYSCRSCGTIIQERYVYRISGSGRCETAIAAADELKATLGVSSFNVIIIASGNDFADALSGSYLAAVKKAPILLYRESSMNLNIQYIKDNLKTGGTIYILGGTAAVPASVENSLSGYNVVRLYGSNRYDTNLAILKEAGVGNKEILVCTGLNFADSLSASATGLPILMVNNSTGKLTSNQISFLQGLGSRNITIIGGTGAVSSSLETALQAYGNVSRISGSSREYTSVLVAKKYFGNPQSVVLAYSRNFPDGLCGGPLAYALGAPLLLTNVGAEAAAASYVAENAISGGMALGGTSALSNDTVATVLAIK